METLLIGWTGAFLALIFVVAVLKIFGRQDSEYDDTCDDDGDHVDSEEVEAERRQEIQAWDVLVEIYDEWRHAKGQHRPLNSSHEALAVMQEEVFKLQTEVYSNERKNPLRMENIRAEAIQVGAMVLRLITDVCDKPTEVQ